MADGTDHQGVQSYGASGRELRITGVGKEMQRLLRNAADYYDSSLSDLVKPKLGEWLDSLPDHVKNFKKIE